MSNKGLRSLTIILAVMAMVAASLACRGGERRELPPTPYVPPAATPESGSPPTVAPVSPTAESGPTPSGGGPNLTITGVTLSNSTPEVDEWVTVQVAVENQGGAAAEGFQLVVIPHYGVGPPNPAGFEDLPSLAPGATHVTTITPGLLYPSGGTYTVRVLVTDDWYELGDPDSTGSAGDFWDETITVAAASTETGGPNLAITGVTLSTNAPPVDGWVVVDVTVENQGGAAAEGFQLVLIPHYGVGPPNPGGFEDLPSIAPGAARGVTFSPGVLYPDAGTFTLRVLVTDDWYELGDPDSTGSAGDFWDETITVGGE